MSRLVIELPSQDEQTALNLRRWAELLHDREVARFEGRIETDRHGRILMSPPAAFDHGRRQSRFPALLESLLLHGQAVTECPISTPDGVRVADAAWISQARLQTIGSEACLRQAPEICVEILSPGNTRQEMSEKKALYFAAGAEEVRFCDGSGRMTFFTNETSPGESKSRRCPEFSSVVEL